MYEPEMTAAGIMAPAMVSKDTGLESLSSKLAQYHVERPVVPTLARMEAPLWAMPIIFCDMIDLSRGHHISADHLAMLLISDCTI